MKAMRSKYRAVRTVVDGITFASKAEAARYGELKLLEKAGKIIGLQLQPSFVLLAGDGKTKVGRYVADFGYIDVKRGAVWEDVKGVRTPVYRLKKKMVEAQVGIKITEVSR